MPASPAPGSSVPIEVDCTTVKAKIDSGDDFLLLDCREREEYQAVHIPQAQLIPMSELTERLAELEPHRQRNIVVHCHHGGRSMQVTNWLRSQGFANVQNMAGGIDAWSVSIDPSLPRY